MNTFKAYLLGVPRFEYEGITIPMPRRKAIALLAYLGVNTQAYHRHILATLLWPSLDESRASTAFRSTLYTITSQLHKKIFNQDYQLLTLNHDQIWVDVLAFRAIFRDVRHHMHEVDSVCHDCHHQLLAAIDYYQGDFLTGFTLNDCPEYEQWQVFQREMLRQEYGWMLKDIAEFYAHDTVREYNQAIYYAQRWLALDSLHESAHRLLMRLYHANRQPEKAIHQYQECVAILNAELLTPPEQSTTQLYEDIRKKTTVTRKLRTIAQAESSILPPLPPLIVGRDEVFTEIKRHLGIGANAKFRLRTVVQGLPGVGKSTLVAALTHDSEIHEKFKDGILWTSLGEAPNLANELSTWSKILGVADPGVSYAITELTALLTTALRDKQVLLIVDDVWRVEDAAPFRVGSQNSAWVLTTRRNDVAEGLATKTDDIYRLPLLSELDGLHLLKIIIPDIVSRHPGEARALINTLQGLPLAIQVAGRLLRNEIKFGWGVSDLLSDLQEGTRLLNEQVPGDMIGPWQATTPTVAALLRRSTDALDAVTRQRFASLGLFIPKPSTFDLRAMAALWQVDDPRPTARILTDRGLLEPLSGGRFQLHSLLVLHARSMTAGRK